MVTDSTSGPKATFSAICVAKAGGGVLSFRAASKVRRAVSPKARLGGGGEREVLGRQFREGGKDRFAQNVESVHAVLLIPRLGCLGMKHRRLHR